MKNRNVDDVIADAPDSAFPLVIATDYETGTKALDCFSLTTEGDITTSD